MKANEKLRILRVMKGYSQEVIANNLGMDSGTYSRIERGVTDLKFEVVGKVLEILNVSWDDFLKYEDSSSQLFNFQHGDNNSFNAPMPETMTEFLKEEIMLLRAEVAELRKINHDLMYQLIKKTE